MKTLTLIARILLGLIFFVFGLNGFLNFMPPPPTGVPQGAMDFSLAMMKTGYFTRSSSPEPRSPADFSCSLDGLSRSR